jgi:hypothetical protein
LTQKNSDDQQRVKTRKDQLQQGNNPEKYKLKQFYESKLDILERAKGENAKEISNWKK